MAVSFWRLQLAGWAAFAIAMGGSRIGRFPIDFMIATKSAMAIMGLLYTGFILRPLYRRTLRGNPPLTRTIGVTVAASYVVALLWTGTYAVIDIFIQRWLLSPEAHLSNFWQVFGGTLYDAFAILAWSVMYVAIKHQQALVLERERTLRAEALAHQARLEALRWQLNPHFLFNALNAISTLVVDGRSTEAATMIARLGDLLRGTLEQPSTGSAPLAAELEMVRRYLDIEQVRLGDRLRFEVAVESDAWSGQVPSLLLQPLVENAIRHAVAPREEGGHVLLTARRIGDRLRLTVEDDGPDVVASIARASNDNGIGLANTRERLLHLYGSAQRLTLGESTLGGLRVEIDMPFHE